MFRISLKIAMVLVGFSLVGCGSSDSGGSATNSSTTNPGVESGQTASKAATHCERLWENMVITAKHLSRIQYIITEEKFLNGVKQGDFRGRLTTLFTKATDDHIITFHHRETLESSLPDITEDWQFIDRYTKQWYRDDFLDFCTEDEQSRMLFTYGSEYVVLTNYVDLKDYVSLDSGEEKIATPLGEFDTEFYRSVLKVSHFPDGVNGREDILSYDRYESNVGSVGDAAGLLLSAREEYEETAASGGDYRKRIWTIDIESYELDAFCPSNGNTILQCMMDITAEAQ